MSLRKKPTLTGKGVAASRANGRLSRGPATREGRERIRDTNTRHGFYSKAEGAALRALGEDPAEFDAVVSALMQKWRPANGFEKLLVMRLARALWGVERGHRMQEGYALRQAKEVNLGREDHLHALMTRQKMASASLQTLAQSVARPHYVTTPDDLELMKNLCREGDVKEMGKMALALFYQLRAPGEEGEEGGRSDPEEDVRKVVAKIRQIFGLSTDPEPGAMVASGSPGPFPDQGIGAGNPSREDPRASAAGGPDVALASGRPPGSQQVRSQDRCESDHRTPEIGDAGAPEADPAASSQPQGSQDDPDAAEAEEEPDYGLSAAEWEAREPVRRLLEHILSRQFELCEAQRHATLRESLMGPSPYERAAEIAPSHRNALLMRRMQDSNFREVWRVTNLLLKVKHQAREEESGESPRDPGMLMKKQPVSTYSGGLS
jgi:hypothetical protein